MWAHGGLGSNVKTRTSGIPYALTSPIHPLEVYLIMDITLQQLKPMWKAKKSNQHNGHVGFSYLPSNKSH
jgi:hypothetical protein